MATASLRLLGTSSRWTWSPERYLVKMRITSFSRSVEGGGGEGLRSMEGGGGDERLKSMEGAGGGEGLRSVEECEREGGMGWWVWLVYERKKIVG